MEDCEIKEREAIRELKWREVMSRVDAYRFYIKLCLEASAFFFATTGVILGFYLNQPIAPLQPNAQPQVTAPPNHNQTFFLLLPILMGTILGCICIYATKLQKEGSRIIEDIRNDLKSKDLITEEVPDVDLLDKLLRIFGCIFILVAVSLIFVPFLKEAGFLKHFNLFAAIAYFILAGGGLWTFHAMRVYEHKKSEGQPVTANSNRSYTVALLLAGLFIVSTAILLGGDGSVFRPTSDTSTLVTVVTAIVSAVGTILATIFAWRNDRRVTRENELKIEQLKQELETLKEKSAPPNPESRK
ncbi:MAG: hypothetical protein QOD32_1169 [Pyrinomonadaceae bacterium]|jgi:hypothetical protein|nr:hypothetical protein [Pyrinomonadaceae bacterium]